MYTYIKALVSHYTFRSTISFLLFTTRRQKEQPKVSPQKYHLLRFTMSPHECSIRWKRRQ